MKIFIDSADVWAIKDAYETGLIDGVTTNPTLIMKSEFAEPSTLKGFDDSELEIVWKQQYSLADFTKADKFKTFEELETRLNTVLSSAPQPPRQTEIEDLEDQSEGLYKNVAAQSAPTFKSASAPSTEEDDALSYFAKLANE